MARKKKSAGKGRARFVKRTAKGPCPKKWRGLAVHRAKNGACYVQLRGGWRGLRRKK